MDLYYIAAPYAHDLEAVMYDRYCRITKFANQLMRYKLHVYSPITHGVPIASYGELSHDFDYWRDRCLDMLDRCDVLIIYMLDGWENSKGVQAELDHAHQKGMRRFYQTPGSGVMWNFDDAEPEFT